MPVKIIAIDQQKSRQFADNIAEYLKRIPKSITLVDLSVPFVPQHKQQMDAEAQSILAHIKTGDFMVVLDMHGQQLTSEEFACQWQRWEQHKVLSFIIGGAWGLAASVKQRANYTMALSLMTIPHRMAKLMLLEQIYRAHAINQGHPYHK